MYMKKKKQELGNKKEKQKRGMKLDQIQNEGKKKKACC